MNPLALAADVAAQLRVSEKIQMAHETPRHIIVSI
jgi:hypothetical protein